MNNRKYTVISEKDPLIPLSRRHPLFYLEKAAIFRKQGDVIVSGFVGEVPVTSTIPVSSIGALLLGPGCSITSEAARICVSRGCMLGITGGGGSPMFMASTQHRSPLNRMKQMQLVLDEGRRLEAGRMLLRERADFIDEFSELGLPRFPSPDKGSSLQQLLALEGAWARRTYAHLSQEFSRHWSGKRAESQTKDNPLSFLNHLAYSIADIAILHMGFDPNIGILHGRTRGGGLSYDLADVFKPVIALFNSFVAMEQNWTLNQVKSAFLRDIDRMEVIDRMIKVLKKVILSHASCD